MSEGFGASAPGGEGPRDESRGEAQIRLASWFKSLLAIFGVRLYQYEEDALATLMGALIRRFPRLGTWNAPKK